MCNGACSVLPSGTTGPSSWPSRWSSSPMILLSPTGNRTLHQDSTIHTVILVSTFIHWTAWHACMHDVSILCFRMLTEDVSHSSCYVVTSWQIQLVFLCMSAQYCPHSNWFPAFVKGEPGQHALAVLAVLHAILTLYVASQRSGAWAWNINFTLLMQGASAGDSDKSSTSLAQELIFLTLTQPSRVMQTLYNSWFRHKKSVRHPYC
jgi:hypothetical protein